jgi:hypothetical protein
MRGERKEGGWRKGTEPKPPKKTNWCLWPSNLAYFLPAAPQSRALVHFLSRFQAVHSGRGWLNAHA